MKLESDLQRRVVQWADDLGGYAVQLVDQQRGWPDLTIFLPDAKIVIPELKRPGKNKRYQMQKVWVKRLQRLGFAADFCQSLDEVKELLEVANV